MDGQYKYSQSGQSDWYQWSQSITGSGTHTIRWTFSKDSSGSAGDDCAWLDYVQWSGSMPDPNGWQTITYTYDPSGQGSAQPGSPLKNQSPAKMPPLALSPTGVESDEHNFFNGLLALRSDGSLGGWDFNVEP